MCINFRDHWHQYSHRGRPFLISQSSYPETHSSIGTVTAIHDNGGILSHYICIVDEVEKKTPQPGPIASLLRADCIFEIKLLAHDSGLKLRTGGRRKEFVGESAKLPTEADRKLGDRS